MKTRLLPGILWLVYTGAAGAEPPPIPDQYGQLGSLADFAGEPVLAIVASSRKLRHLGKWEEVLREEFPDLVSLRVADITANPRPAEAEVAKTLRKRVPENVSILIDLNNQWASDYELDTGEPCLLVFDSNHAIVARFRGRPRNSLVQEVSLVLSEYFPLTAASP